MVERPQEIRRFLCRQSAEVAPVLDPKLQQALEALCSEESPCPAEQLEAILDAYETKVLYSEKAASGDTKRVLISAAEPLAHTTVAPIVERLKVDPRCASITLLTDNVAGKAFASVGFSRLRDATRPVFTDLPGLVDIALVPVDPPNSPNAPLLYGAKSVFGATRLFFLVSGWGGVGGTTLFAEGRREAMDPIDGFIVNDELAKRFLQLSLPGIPEERIIVTNLPIMDALERHRSAEHTAVGRGKLGLSEETLAVLYVGDVSNDYHRLDPTFHEHINEKTFFLTLTALFKAAMAQPERSYALLVRPHPRDPKREELLEVVQAGKLTPNLHAIKATNDIVSMTEAAYAADVILSIGSTENFLAPLRNRRAVFLSFEGTGLGGYALQRTFGSDGTAAIEEAPQLHLASSPDELREYLRSAPVAHEPVADAPPPGHVTARIVDLVLQ